MAIPFAGIGAESRMTRMTRALAVLLSRAIDYAGVFPPAKLDLALAYDDYSRYRRGREAWILGKLVVRTTQLGDLARLIEQRPPEEPIAISAIGRSGADRASWEIGLEADAASLNAFEANVGELATIEAYETRLPDNDDAAGWIRDLHGFSGVDVYAELTWAAGQGDAMAVAAETEFVKVKARTGGEVATTFPTPAQLAGFIQGAVQLGLAFKLTAGLHHAFPHHAAQLGVRMQGFVPVFAATACAFAHDLSIRELTTILDIDSPNEFVFLDGALIVQNWTVGLDDLADTRECIVAFGSCSIDEPLETLKGAGLDID